MKKTIIVVFVCGIVGLVSASTNKQAVSTPQNLADDSSFEYAKALVDIANKKRFTEDPIHALFSFVVMQQDRFIIIPPEKYDEKEFKNDGTDHYFPLLPADGKYTVYFGQMSVMDTRKKSVYAGVVIIRVYNIKESNTYIAVPDILISHEGGDNTEVEVASFLTTEMKELLAAYYHSLFATTSEGESFKTWRLKKVLDKSLLNLTDKK